MTMNLETWWAASKGDVHKLLIQHVQKVELEQEPLFSRFIKLAALYDQNSPWAQSDQRDQSGIVTENVVATNVDTVAAQISSQKVRSRFPTDGADWSTQRLAKQLEYYAE
jgi:hypothetical protein